MEWKYGNGRKGKKWKNYKIFKIGLKDGKENTGREILGEGRAK